MSSSACVAGADRRLPGSVSRTARGGEERARVHGGPAAGGTERDRAADGHEQDGVAEGDVVRQHASHRRHPVRRRLEGGPEHDRPADGQQPGRLAGRTELRQVARNPRTRPVDGAATPRTLPFVLVLPPREQYLHETSRARPDVNAWRVCVSVLYDVRDTARRGLN